MQQPPPTLDSVFAPVHVLSVPARLRLMDLLAVPGQVSPLLPRQLAASPLPSDHQALDSIRVVIETGLDGSALAALGTNRLDVVVPALVRADPAAVIAGVPSRIRDLIAEHTFGTPLGGLCVEQVAAWSGFGPKRVAALIGAAVAAATEVVRRPDEWLAHLDDALTAAGDERDRAVFQNDVLPLGSPIGRPELALALGIGVERVRRLAVRATHRVSVALDQPPRVIDQLTATMTERLGAAAPVPAIDQVLTELGLPALPDTRSLLLAWSAGPYRAFDGNSDWVVLAGSDVSAQTKRLIHEDGGVRPLEHVVADLHHVGVHPDHAGDWLALQPIRIGHGLVVATAGQPGDVAERALHAFGRSMSINELTEWLPGRDPAVLGLFSTRDRRFHRTADDRLALAEWGDPFDRPHNLMSLSQTPPWSYRSGGGSLP